MADTQDQFDMSLKMEEPANTFKVVHLCNKSEMYHLTKQVLLDSALTQDTYCFFYHILAMNVDEFNSMYSSFACLIEISSMEADLYLNVNSEALNHIVQYVQTGKMDEKKIYSDNWKIIDEIIDLATMFGMPKLVSKLRNLHPTEEKINEIFDSIKMSAQIFLHLWKTYIDNDYNVELYMGCIEKFMKDEKQSIIDNYIKPTMYQCSPLSGKLLTLFVQTLYIPFLTKYAKNMEQEDSCDKTCEMKSQHAPFCQTSPKESSYMCSGSDKMPSHMQQPTCTKFSQNKSVPCHSESMYDCFSPKSWFNPPVPSQVPQVSCSRGLMDNLPKPCFGEFSMGSCYPNKYMGCVTMDNNVCPLFQENSCYPSCGQQSFCMEQSNHMNPMCSMGQQNTCMPKTYCCAKPLFSCTMRPQCQMEQYSIEIPITTKCMGPSSKPSPNCPVFCQQNQASQQVCPLVFSCEMKHNFGTPKKSEPNSTCQNKSGCYATEPRYMASCTTCPSSNKGCSMRTCHIAQEKNSSKNPTEDFLNSLKEEQEMDLRKCDRLIDHTFSEPRVYPSQNDRKIEDLRKCDRLIDHTFSEPRVSLSQSDKEIEDQPYNPLQELDDLLEQINNCNCPLMRQTKQDCGQEMEQQSKSSVQELDYLMEQVNNCCSKTMENDSSTDSDGENDGELVDEKMMTEMDKNLTMMNENFNEAMQKLVGNQEYLEKMKNSLCEAIKKFLTPETDGKNEPCENKKEC